MTNLLNVAIHGASGRNGRRLIALGSADPSLSIIGAIVRSGSEYIGRDAGSLAGIQPIDLLISDKWPSNAQCVIDFSSPEGSQSALRECIARKIPLVIESTGLSSEQVDNIKAASHSIAVCYAPNMSVAVNLTMKLVEQAARALKDVPGGADVEVIERHHRYKEDSPSGTAIKFGHIVAHEMGIENHVHGRVGQIGTRSDTTPFVSGTMLANIRSYSACSAKRSNCEWPHPTAIVMPAVPSLPPNS
jgi:4-hydroxy-tetrahydrodipicolinate reductase